MGIIALLSMFGFVLGAFIGGIVAIIVDLRDKDNKEAAVPVDSIRKAIDVADHLAFTEQFLSVEEAASIKKLVEYSRRMLDREDDLK